MDNTEVNGNVASTTPIVLPEEGKKSYDLTFLYHLKNSSLSKVKPENIMPDIIRDDTQRVGDMRGMNIPTDGPTNNNLMPGFAQRSNRNTLPNRRSQGKPSLRPNTSMGSSRPMGGARQISISLRSDVKLNETENAWKPSRMRSEDIDETEKETQDILKKFRSVLNKLTPQKFNTLIAQVRELNINTIDRLKGVINLVFEKAIEEPNFSATYAQMCKELEQIKVTPSADEKATTFRLLIIGRCQEEFEKETRDDGKTLQRQQEIDSTTDPDKKKELQLLLEEDKRKIRMRSVGNVRFIGEMFKLNIITARIMLSCIDILLSKIEEETLECLCKFLTTIGKNLETVQKKDLSKYFVDLKDIVDKKKGQNISSRVRFMIQDVIDLRARNWVPRKIVAQSNPKTIDQIQIEADMEHMLIYQNNYNNPPPPPRQDDRFDNQDRPMNKRGASRSVNDDGWTQAPTRNSRTKPTNFSVDSEKLSKITSFSPVTHSMTLGPATMVSWGRGASSKNSFPPRNNNNVKKSTSTESRNMYNVLLQEPTTELPPVPPTNKKNGKKSHKRDRPEAMRSISVEYNPAPPTRNQECIPFGNDDISQIHDLMSKCQNDKTFIILDKINTDLIAKEIAVDVVMKEIVLWSFEFANADNIQIFGEVTGRMVHDNAISKDQFVDIFKSVIDRSFDLFLEGGDDGWYNLAGFIWGHLIKDPLTMPELRFILNKIVEIGRGYDFLVAFFNIKSDAKATALWENSKMSLSDWFSQDKEDKFRKSVPLKCFGHQQVTEPAAAMAELMALMKAETPPKKIEEWILASIPNPEEIWFIRALTEAVYTFVLCPTENTKPRFDDIHAKKRLDTYYKLLITFIGNKQKPELELHCLYAIQHLIHKLEHPMNLSNLIFDHLLDCGEVITNETFLTWESSTDQREIEGRGVLLKSLTSFFTALKSNEDESSSNEESST